MFETRLAEPSATIITVAQAKETLRLEHSEHDAMLSVLVSAASRAIEEMTGRALVTQTWRQDMATVSGDAAIRLNRTPVQSVTAVAYHDRDKALQSLDLAGVQLFGADAAWFVRPLHGTSWPPMYDRPDAPAHHLQRRVWRRRLGRARRAAAGGANARRSLARAAGSCHGAGQRRRDAVCRAAPCRSVPRRLDGSMRSGALSQRLAFDEPSEQPDDFGGVGPGWSERFQRWCELIYQRGDEAVQARRLAGRSIYKIRVRSSADTRGLTTDWRCRDVRRRTSYNIREVDAVTDRAWVYLVVEGGGAS